MVTDTAKGLGFGKDLLEQYFRGRVSWINPTGNTRVEVRVTCTNDKQYTLRVYLPSDYPNSCPDVVVSNPSSCLRKRDGSLLSYTDGGDHTLDSRDGCTKICHFRSSLWRDDNTVYQVVMKGLIWLEAIWGTSWNWKLAGKRSGFTEQELETSHCTN